MHYFWRPPKPSNLARLLQLLGLVVGVVAVLAAIGVALNRWDAIYEDDFESLADLTGDEEVETGLSLADEV
ncbi:MAG: hypothetical protein GKR89_23795 [Candidatus Latescibacteria bacterium]|nr:hypothetical protein [Candidatus Latescibacterota bacterium]